MVRIRAYAGDYMFSADSVVTLRIEALVSGLTLPANLAALADDLNHRSALGPTTNRLEFLVTVASGCPLSKHWTLLGKVWVPAQELSAAFHRHT